MTEATPPTLAELEQRLLAAANDHAAAVINATEARRAETARFNDLNEAQKQVDARIQQMRKEATGGDWASSRGRATAE